MSNFKPGDKIQYKTVDGKGKEKWLNGAVHGVRSAETDSGEQVIAYLIDTGKEASRHEVVYSKQAREIDTRVREMQGKGMSHKKAFKEVSGHTDLPAEDEIGTDVITQPEQVEVRPGDVRAR